MKTLSLYFITCCLFVANILNAQPSSPANIVREAEYDVKFYWLDLDIEQNNSKISGNVLIRATSLINGMDTFSVELVTDFTIDSAEAALNGASFQQATVKRGSGTDVNILLPFTANANQSVETRIYYHGTAATSFINPTGAAFFKGPPVFSASPPYNACTWWPCKQNLVDKADSSWFFITTDSASTAVAEGVLTNTVSIPPSKKRWEWKSHHPIDFYLVSFLVGTMSKSTAYFHAVGGTDSMPVYGYGGISPSQGVDILKKFSDKFGLYPFYDEKLGVANVQLGGGMENQTIIPMGNIGTVMEHEIMHQWFGDNVTCASYKDLWLNEGFARWAESLYPELSAANAAAANTARINICNQFENGYPPFGFDGGLKYPAGSVYYFNTDTVGFMSLYGGQGRAMNYEKPAMMINSLRFEINNDALFFQGLKNYQTQFSGKTASGNDFIDMMENTTGMDLTDFFNQWYLGYGFPTFNVKWNHTNNQLMLQVTEAVSDAAKTPLFKTSLEIKAHRTGGDTTVRIFVDNNTATFNVPCGDSVTGLVIDPNQWILNKPGTTLKDTSLFVTGIEPLQNDEPAFSIFPNPASDYLYIRSSLSGNQPLEAELYNTVGQKIQSSRLNPHQPFKLPSLPDGMYFLQINSTWSFKVLIVH